MDNLNHEVYVNYIIENIIDFGKTNFVSIVSMVGGIALGQSETHKTLGEYLTDPTTVGLIKDYVSIILAIGGFLLMMYNTFKKKKK